jgi:hypothetical protein
MAWPKGVPHPNAGFSCRRRPAICARGRRVCQTLRRASITLDDQTFAEIRKRAVKARFSLCAEVRNLLEIGLETVKAAGV